MTQVGTVPASYGAAQTGGKVYLAGRYGDIIRIDEIPTQHSTSPITTDVVAQTSLTLYGATSKQDSGLCSELVVSKAADPASTTSVLPGQSVSYSLTFSNAHGTAPAEVSYVDDLAKVLDDAIVTQPPAVTQGGDLTVGEVADGRFTVEGTIPAGGEATVSYVVQVSAPGDGDRQLTNFLRPADEQTPVTCAADSNLCTTHPVSALVLVKSVSPDDLDSYEAGQELTYSFAVTNTGTTTLADVSIAEGEFDGTGELSAISPASVKELAPGESTTFTATYTLIKADATPGSTTNTATATATPPQQDNTSSPHPPTATVTGKAAGRQLAKTGTDPLWAGLLSATVLVMGLAAASSRRRLTHE